MGGTQGAQGIPCKPRGGGGRRTRGFARRGGGCGPAAHLSPGPGPGQLFPAPLRIGSEDSADIHLRALSERPLTGDERSAGVIRSDTSYLGVLSFGLSGAVGIAERKGALLLTGAPALTEASLRRWHIATLVLRYLDLLNPRTGEWWDLASVERGAYDMTYIGPPRWWIEGGRIRWQLTGGLFRPVQLAGARGGGIERYSAPTRTLSGLEAMLHYSPRRGGGSVRGLRSRSGPRADE